MADESVGKAWIDLGMRGDLDKMVRERLAAAEREAARRPIVVPWKPREMGPLNQPGSAAAMGSTPMAPAAAGGGMGGMSWGAMRHAMGLDTIAANTAAAAFGGGGMSMPGKGADGLAAGRRWLDSKQALPGNPFSRIAENYKDRGAYRIGDVAQKNPVSPMSLLNAAASGNVMNVLSALGPLGTTASIVAGTFMRLANAASPNTVATFNASLELLTAKLGRGLLPVLDDFSRGLQAAAILLDKINPPQSSGQSGKGVKDINWGETIFKSLLGAPQMAVDLIPREKGGKLDRVLNAPADALMRSLIPGGAVSGLVGGFADVMGVTAGNMARSSAGLPQAQYSSFSEYADRIDLAGLKSDSLEGKIQAEQLQNLKNISNNTEGIKNLTQAMQRYLAENPPAFRN